jgi:MFS family permease
LEPFFAIYLYTGLGLPFWEVGALLLGIAAPGIASGLGGGLLADRWGRHPMILATTALEGLGLAILALAILLHYASGAFAGYFLASLAGGLGLPAISAFVSDSLQRGSARTQAFSGLRVADNAGAALGIAAGGILLSVLGFFGAALLAAVLVGAVFLLLLLTLPPSPFDEERASRSAPDRGGAASKEPRPSLRESLGVVSRDRLFLLVCAGFLCIGFVQAFFVTAIPLYANLFLGIPFWLLGAALAMNAVLVVLTQSATTTRVVGKSLTKAAMVGGLAYFAAFLIFGAGGDWRGVSILAFFVGMVVLTLGENLVEIPKRTLPSNMAPPAEIGNYNGAFRAIFQTGQTLSPLGAGLAFTLIGSPLVLWLVLSVPVLPTLLLLRYVAPRISRDADRA